MQYLCTLFNFRRKWMKYKNIIKLRLPEIQLLAIVPTQLKFNIIKDHDEPTILLFETLFCMWECFNMGTELPTKVILGQTLVLMPMTFLNNVRKVGRLILSRTSCFLGNIRCLHVSVFLTSFHTVCRPICMSWYIELYCILMCKVGTCGYSQVYVDIGIDGTFPGTVWQPGLRNMFQYGVFSLAACICIRVYILE
jgi:hypothetical protein